jgi:hypothetical protein
MHVWRDKLELGTPRKGDCLFEGSAGVVVHDLDINRQPFCSQMSHDDVVGSKMMGIALGFEGLLEDQVAICMVRNHDILVARACPDRETTCVISIVGHLAQQSQNVRSIRPRPPWAPTGLPLPAIEPLPRNLPLTKSLSTCSLSASSILMTQVVSLSGHARATSIS